MLAFSTAKLIAGALIAGTLLAIGAGLGVRLCSRHFEPLLATANRQLGAASQALAQQSAAYATLAQKTSAQNAAIGALQQAATQREQAASSAIAKAAGTSAHFQKQAAALLTRRPPSGSNLCTAASQLIDSQIKPEPAP